MNADLAIGLVLVFVGAVAGVFLADMACEAATKWRPRAGDPGQDPAPFAA